MSERLFCKRVQTRLRRNPFYEWIVVFIAYLEELGFAQPLLQCYVRHAEHFLWWKFKRGTTCDWVSDGLIDEFLSQHIPQCDCPPPAPRSLITASASLHHLIKALDKAERLKKPATELSEIDEELERFSIYLKDTCGLADATCKYRVRDAHDLLQELCKYDAVDFDRIVPEQVIKFMSRRAETLKPGSLQVLACSVRCYLRFLVFRRKISPGLVNIVPHVPIWKLSSVPMSISPEEIGRLLGVFDSATATGRRDLAIALCFVEYGLRTGEVAGLRLDGIDWRNGTIAVRRTKSKNSHLLPLTERVGKAIANYLEDGRPNCNDSHLFLRHTTPVGLPVSRELVRGVIRRAYKRCAIAPPIDGPRTLRHSLATHLVNSGVSIKEIADLLGHKSIETTAIYSKVNMAALSQVAMPWVEVKDEDDI